MPKFIPSKLGLALLLLVTFCSGCQTNNGQEESSSSIPLKELRALAEKGESLSWNDFKAYPYEDEGSGLYIRKYNVEGGHQLIISGKSLDNKPDHIYVVNKDGEKIDLSKENIKDLNF
ncbi:hypothetical protein JNUCC31_32325 [Paenibacillus sp. JNUCC31]|uniref:hypothetical protein n=1 Tax=Paenibacillus sp. JNUCC-31 TaxID=2777983 RepID=UPI001783D72C|nr:hypothetical protein [Paenibacillus sp. JNUCC-31]QOS79281.1 hypothetical protein JNUCC31_32325 [Paenibacillus sp. JNUCC-31]